MVKKFNELNESNTNDKYIYTIDEFYYSISDKELIPEFIEKYYKVLYANDDTIVKIINGEETDQFITYHINVIDDDDDNPSMKLLYVNKTLEITRETIEKEKQDKKVTDFNL